MNATSIKISTLSGFEWNKINEDNLIEHAIARLCHLQTASELLDKFLSLCPRLPVFPFVH